MSFCVQSVLCLLVGAGLVGSGLVGGGYRHVAQIAKCEGFVRTRGGALIC